MTQSLSDRGDWPTLRAYLEWAKAQGCIAETREISRDGQPLLVASLTAPGGRHAVEVAAEADDPLMSSTIARLDRRLGLKSWLFR